MLPPSTSRRRWLLASTAKSSPCDWTTLALASTATIGIRGTDFDASCAGDCTDSNLTLFAWLGAIAVTPQGQTALQVLQAGQGLFVSPTGEVLPITAPPAMEGPRPDQVPVPPKLFAMENVPDSQEGLFIYVRDGQIEVATASEVLHLGRGEAGFAGLQGGTARPADIPKFLDFDTLPLPDSRNWLLEIVLRDQFIKAKNTCS